MFCGTETNLRFKIFVFSLSLREFWLVMVVSKPVKGQYVRSKELIPDCLKSSA